MPTLTRRGTYSKQCFSFSKHEGSLHEPIFPQINASLLGHRGKATARPDISSISLSQCPTYQRFHPKLPDHIYPIHWPLFQCQYLLIGAEQNTTPGRRQGHLFCCLAGRDTRVTNLLRAKILTKPLQVLWYWLATGHFGTHYIYGSCLSWQSSTVLSMGLVLESTLPEREGGNILSTSFWVIG